MTAAGFPLLGPGASRSFLGMPRRPMPVSFYSPALASPGGAPTAAGAPGRLLPGIGGAGRPGGTAAVSPVLNPLTRTTDRLRAASPFVGNQIGTVA